MSQVEKEVVNSPSEVLSPGSGLHASLVLSPHPSGLEHTVIITTSHSHCHHNRREESLLFTSDCRQLDPCNLEKYGMSQVGVALWLLYRFFPPCPAPHFPKSSFFSNWKTVMNETVWAQGFGYKPKGQTESTPEVKQGYNFGLPRKRMPNPGAESLGALDSALCEWKLIASFNQGSLAGPVSEKIIKTVKFTIFV